MNEREQLKMKIEAKHKRVAQLNEQLYRRNLELKALEVELKFVTRND